MMFHIIYRRKFAEQNVLYIALRKEPALTQEKYFGPTAILPTDFTKKYHILV